MQEEEWDPAQDIDGNGSPEQPGEPWDVRRSVESEVEREHGAASAEGRQEIEKFACICNLDTGCNASTF